MVDDLSTDIIREIINIGIGDAAYALSELAGTAVLINTPMVRILKVDEVPEYIRQEVPSVGVYISQDFEGLMAGRALLFYTTDCSLSLLRAIVKETNQTTSLTQTDMATLQEIGNIILGSCLATIGNLLEARFRFSMPHVTVEVSDQYFRNLLQELSTYERAVVLKTSITVRENDIRGHIFFLLSFKDFHLLVEKLKTG